MARRSYCAAMAPAGYVALDFDGTCTQIDLGHAAFLTAYVEELRTANHGAPSEQEWKDALAEVRAGAPKAGWTLFDAPSTAPAGADPYIQAGEAAALLARRVGIRLPDTAFANADRDHPAPWRDEVADVLAALVARGFRVGFISNSKTKKIEDRLDALLAGHRELRAAIRVRGDAKKYKIQELPFAFPPAPHGELFERVPATHPAATAAVGRPVYLRRGAYFAAICELWGAFGESGAPLADTVFCGDIWELDLAMPQALGAPVHLIRRAEPYPSYPYELAQLAPAHQSDDLLGLLARL